MNKIIPAVDDVDLFEKAFHAWHAAWNAAPDGDREPAGIGAIFRVVCADKDNPELFKAVSSRVLLLGDLIHARRKRVSKYGGFPGSWLEVAASTPLEWPNAKTFDASLFTWPSAKERESMVDASKF